MGEGLGFMVSKGPGPLVQDLRLGLNGAPPIERSGFRFGFRV